MEIKISNYCTLPEKPLKMDMIETVNIISTETPSFLYTSPSPLFHLTSSKNKTNTTMIMSFPAYSSRRSPFRIHNQRPIHPTPTNATWNPRLWRIDRVIWRFRVFWIRIRQSYVIIGIWPLNATRLGGCGTSLLGGYLKRKSYRLWLVVPGLLGAWRGLRSS